MLWFLFPYSETISFFFQLSSWVRNLCWTGDAQAANEATRTPRLTPYRYRSPQTKVQPHGQRCGLCAFSVMNKQGNLGLSTLRCLPPLSRSGRFAFQTSLWPERGRKKPHTVSTIRRSDLACLTSDRGSSLLPCFSDMFHQHHGLLVPSAP